MKDETGARERDVNRLIQVGQAACCSARSIARQSSSVGSVKLAELGERLPLPGGEGWGEGGPNPATIGDSDFKAQRGPTARGSGGTFSDPDPAPTSPRPSPPAWAGGEGVAPGARLFAPPVGFVSIATRRAALPPASAVQLP